MAIDWTLATAADAEELASLRSAAAEELGSRYGDGPWSGRATLRGALASLRYARVLIGRLDGEIVASLRLANRKPWAIDPSLFTPVRRPIYLTSMVVAPRVQRRGIGREALDHACRLARESRSDAIRLDAFDAAAGAGGFYARCGFREVGRATYRGVPHVYFERLL